MEATKKKFPSVPSKFVYLQHLQQLRLGQQQQQQQQQQQGQKQLQLQTPPKTLESKPPNRSSQPPPDADRSDRRAEKGPWTVKKRPKQGKVPVAGDPAPAPGKRLDWSAAGGGREDGRRATKKKKKKKMRVRAALEMSKGRTDAKKEVRVIVASKRVR